MTSQGKRVILAFDVYGTLLSTHSIWKKLASYVGEEKAKTIATTWRTYQLEYTWRLNSMGIYLGFDVVTRRSLRHALLESGSQLDEDQENDMMTAYDSLSTLPDVRPTLDKLAGVDGVKILAFSNGTHQMISRSMRNAPDLLPHADTFHDIISVEDCRKFKPAAEAYWHLAQKMGIDTMDSKGMAEMWLVSGNPFDVVGARGTGMNAIWVDRAGTGWQDQLSSTLSLQPTVVVKSLEEVAGIVEKELS